MATIYKRSKTGPYWGSFYLDGKRVRFSTGTGNRKLAQAEAERREEEARVTTSNAVTLLTAAARFLVLKSHLKPKTLVEYRASAIRLEQVLGDVSLDLVSSTQLKKFALQRLQEGAKVGGRRDLAFLSSLYSTARKWPDGPKQSPFTEFEMKDLPDAEHRNLWLTDDEIDRLLNVCHTASHRCFVTLAVDTGMRKMEMLHLRWSEVDLSNRLIIIGNRDRLRTKGGVGRVIPMTERVHDTLSDTRGTGEWVFPGPDPRKPINSVKTFWKRATKDAGLEGVRVHDLRHTFGTRAQQKGVDTYALMDIMGHKSITSSKRYIHPSIESKRAAILKIQGS